VASPQSTQRWGRLTGRWGRGSARPPRHHSHVPHYATARDLLTAWAVSPAS